MATTQRIEAPWLPRESAGAFSGTEMARSLWRKTLALTCYRRLHLFSDDLLSEVRAPKPCLGIEVRAIEETDVEEYLQRSGSGSRAHIVWKLRSGHDCFAAFEDGRMVGHVWSAPKYAKVRYVDLAVYLERDVAYSYDLQVMPEHRGRGVAGELLRARRPLLRAMGYRRTVSAIVPWNVGAMRVAEAGGREFLGLMDVRFLGRWRRGRIRFAPGKSALAPIRLRDS